MRGAVANDIGVMSPEATPETAFRSKTAADIDMGLPLHAEKTRMSRTTPERARIFALFRPSDKTKARSDGLDPREGGPVMLLDHLDAGRASLTAQGCQVDISLTALMTS